MVLTVTGTKQPLAAANYAYAITKTGIFNPTAGQGLLSQAPKPTAAGDTLIVDPSQTAALSADGAKVILQPNGGFEYDPIGAFPALGQGQTATDTFTYVIDDKFGSTAMGTVTITVTGVEDPPVAPTVGVSAGLWTVPGQVLTVSAANGLLAQASSPDAGATSQLTAFAGSKVPKNPNAPTTTLSKDGATVTVNPDGSYTYDPTNSLALQKLTAGGADVVDTFEYGVLDPDGTFIDPTVSIVVMGGPSPYRYQVIASTASGQYSSLGTGPSINNLGNAAFEGAGNPSISDLYIWAPATSGTSTPPAVSILDPDFVANNAPGTNESQVPFEQFGPDVQINGSNYVIAQRVLGAQGLIGILPAGLPAVAPTQFLLSYAEIYFGSAALAGDATAAAYQVGVADGGLSSSGVQWGSPNFEDMEFAHILTVLSTSIVGFAASSEAFPDFLLPRAWITNPAWAGLFPSPVDQLWTSLYWDASLVSPSAAVNGIGAFALALALAPNALQLRQQDVDSFTTIWPYVSLSNGPPQPSSLPGYYAFNPGYISFAAQVNSQLGGQNAVITSNHIAAGGGSTPLEGLQTGSNIDYTKVGNDGSVVLSTGSSLLVFPFDLTTPQSATGFTSVGPFPSISNASDNSAPWVAFAGNSPTLGQGNFVAPASNPSQWYQVVGVPTSGTLAPDETMVNGQIVSPLTSIDLNGNIGINGNPTTGFTVSFYGTTSRGYGLQTVKFLPPTANAKPPNTDPASSNPHLLPRNDFLGFANVVTVGDIIPGAGTISKISTYDPVNVNGQIVFWAQTNNGQVIVVANPPLPTNGQIIYALADLPLSTNTFQNQTLSPDQNGVVVATFLATNSQTTAGNYQAMIDWGDGSAPTPGTIVATPLVLVTPNPNPQGAPLTTTTQVPGLYAVEGDHTYDEAGPYIITVFITDTLDHLGGVAATYVDVVATTNDDDTQEYDNDDDSTKLVSFVQSAPFGLNNYVSVNQSQGTFTVAAVGVGQYSYSFELSQDDGNSPGDPNDTVNAQKGTVTLQAADTSGRIDLLNFSLAGFSVTSYSLTANSQMQLLPDANMSPQVTADAGDTYTLTSTSTVTQSDSKTYTSTGTSLSWSHTETSTTTYLRTGERTTDDNVSGQTDGLMNEDASVLADEMSNLSLVGSYTMTGTATATTTLTETGSEKGTVSLNYQTVENGTYTQTASLEDLTQHQTVHNQSTETEQKGQIQPQTGQYTLSIVAATTDTILSQNETDGSQSTTLTGTNSVNDTLVKSGVNPVGQTDFGGFTTTATVTTSSSSVATVTDETSKLVQTASATSTGTQTVSASPGGDYSIKGAVTTLSSTFTSHQTDQTQTDNAKQTDNATQTLNESGSLFTGQYTTTTSSTSTATSQETVTDQQSSDITTSQVTATAAETFTSDRQSGDYTDAEGSTSTASTTDTSSDETQSMSITETATETEGQTESGNLSAGTYTIAPGGSFDIIQATTTGGGVDGTQMITLSGSSFERDDANGGGATDGGVYSLTQTSVSTVTSVQKTSDKSLSTTASDTTTDNDTSTQTGDSIVGNYTTTDKDTGSDFNTQSSADSSQTVLATSTSTSSESYFDTGNEVTGTYTTTDSAVATSTAFQTSTDQSSTDTMTSFVTTTESSSETGNDISGTYTSTDISQATETDLDQSTDTHGGAMASTTASTSDASSETDIETGNDISGAYTVTTRATDNNTSTQTSTDLSETEIASASSVSFDTSTDTGNNISGTYTTTDSAMATSTSFQTSMDQSSADTITSFVTNTATSSQTGNEITGTYTSTVVTQATETDLEQSTDTDNGAVASTTASTSDVSTETDIETGNDISGAYTLSSSVTDNNTSTQTSTDGSQTDMATASSINFDTSTDTGNDITGTYSATDSAMSTSTSFETSTDQSSADTITSFVTTTATSTQTGNDITGNYTSTAVSQTTETDLEQSTDTHNSTVASTTASSSDASTETDIETGNTIAGDYTTTVLTTDSNAGTQTSTDGNETDMARSSAHSFESSTDAGNNINGAYSATDSAMSMSTSFETSTDQASADTVTSFVTTTATSTQTGNDLTGNYTSTAVSLATETDLEQSTVTQAGAVASTTASTSDASTETDIETGNTITGDFTTTVQVSDSNTSHQTSTDGDETDTAKSSSVSFETSTSTGNDITGTYTTTDSLTSTATTVSTSTDLTSASVNTETDAATSTSTETGNQITGDYTTTSVEADSMTSVETDTNTGQNVTAATSSTSLDSSTETGNTISGTYSATDTNQSTVSIAETGTIADRSFTCLKTDATMSNDMTTGDDISGDETDIGTTTDNYSATQDTTYTDGFDHYDETQTTVSTDSYTGNDITGTYSSFDSSSTQTNVTGFGNQGSPYTISSFGTDSATTTQTGNSISGSFTETDFDSSMSTEIQSAPAANGSFTQTQATTDTNMSTQTGDSISGSYAQTTTDDNTVTTDQISSGGGSSFTVHDVATSLSTATELGNSIAGTFTGTGNYADSDALTEIGQAATGAFTYTDHTTDTGNQTDQGNSVLGLTTTTANDTQVYSFTQTIGGNQGYTLTGNGTNKSTQVETQNAITSQDQMTTTGADTFTLNQTGSDAQGAYQATLKGTDTYGQAESINEDTGVYTITTTGTGPTTKSVTRNGVTTTTTIALTYTDTQAGNDLTGQTTLTRTGTDRYAALGHYTDTSNQGQGTPGNLDFSPVGTPIVVGATASVPHEYCFAAGTLVLLADGSSKPIELIQPGEMVLAAPDSDPLAKPEPRRVLRTFHNAPAAILTLHVGDDVVRTTFGHPFYTRRSGWLLAGKLCIGDDLRTVNGRWLAVTDVSASGEPEPVYNLQVEGHGTYFVVMPICAGAVLVHNASITEVGPTPDQLRQYLQSRYPVILKDTHGNIWALDKQNNKWVTSGSAQAPPSGGGQSYQIWDWQHQTWVPLGSTGNHRQDIHAGIQWLSKDQGPLGKAAQDADDWLGQHIDPRILGVSDKAMQDAVDHYQWLKAVEDTAKKIISAANRGGPKGPAPVANIKQAPPFKVKVNPSIGAPNDWTAKRDAFNRARQNPNARIPTSTNYKNTIRPAANKEATQARAAGGYTSAVDADHPGDVRATGLLGQPLNPLHNGVNRSVGSQIGHQIRTNPGTYPAGIRTPRMVLVDQNGKTIP